MVDFAGRRAGLDPLGSEALSIVTGNCEDVLFVESHSQKTKSVPVTAAARRRDGPSPPRRLTASCSFRRILLQHLRVDLGHDAEDNHERAHHQR